MPSWKQVLLKAAGFGAGFALCSIAFGLVWYWYSSRPRPPKPWNEKAITAEYDVATTEGNDKTFVIYYTLQNNTDFDYKVQDQRELSFAGELRRQKGASFDHEDDFYGGNFPLFIPAHGRVRFGIHVKYPYKNGPTEPREGDDAIYDYNTGVAKYLKTEFKNLNGFVMYDSTNRYQIRFPNGWDKRAEEPLRLKSANTNPATAVK